MNTNHLARAYDQLTPQERLALVLAASARRDDVELDRLMTSAPRFGLTAPHHFGLTEAFLLLSMLQFMELLEMAGAYLAAFEATGNKRKQEREAAWEQVMLLGYYFQTYLAGWRQFCTEMNFEPEVMWETYPGYRTIQAAERMTSPNPQTGLPGPAYVAEGVARYRARQELGDPEADLDEATLKPYWPMTADHLAACQHEAWKHLKVAWGQRLGGAASG
jgi:hypothetical protein